MFYLILIFGVALWSGAHLFKRLAPAQRAPLGEQGKGIVAVLLLVSIVLMVIGYRGAEGGFLWGRHPATVGINNLLMLLSFYLFAVSGAKTALSRKMRHPQLIAFKTWTVAHLLVNGDVPSLILFGGLLAWAVVEVIVINRQDGDWTPPTDPIPMRKEISAVVATVVLYAVVAWIHAWLGYPVFG